MGIHITIPIKKITYLLLFFIVMLSSISFFSMVIAGVVHDEHALEHPLVNFFYLDAEQNLSTWFSTMLLAIDMLLLFLIAYRTRILKQKHFVPWLILGFIFLALSIDEFTSVHERLKQPVQILLDTSGLLYFAWVIPVAIIVVIVGLAYLPFLFRLPRRTQKLFILAALLYIGGAMVIESIGGLRWSDLEAAGVTAVPNDFIYNVIITLEELFEMVGTLIFFYALSLYLYEYQSFPLASKATEKTT